MAKKDQVAQFVFKSTDVIGCAAAEDDQEFLRDCFVDTDESDLLSRVDDHRIIVLGRTGAGKSALFEHFVESRDGKVIMLDPQNLALSHVSHSTILNTFIGLGVNLDPLFSLLWRHILVVEILNRFFQHHPQPIDDKSLISQIKSWFGAKRQDASTEVAINYLEKWGNNVFKQSDQRVQDITTKMEVQLTESIKAKLGMKAASLEVDAADIMKMSAEEKQEIVNYGQTVVSRAQSEDLAKLTQVLGAILEDRQQQYFVLIDRLDVNWVEERIRYKLIMALIQTATEFIHVRNAKVVLALRRDLIDRVFRLTRDSGFQEEKFTSRYLQLRWTKDKILQVLDRRIAHLVRQRYTKSVVGYRELLPTRINQTSIEDFIFDRCKRPRDVIAFFNECIGVAAGSSKLTATKISAAEAEYSQGRLLAVADEWHAEEPLLLEFADILKGRSSTFRLSTISQTDVEDLCLKVVAENPSGFGTLFAFANSTIDGTIDPNNFVVHLFRAFYKVGIVGLKTSAAATYSWELDSVRAPHHAEVNRVDTSVVIAPMYWRALGVRGDDSI